MAHAAPREKTHDERQFEGAVKTLYNPQVTRERKIQAQKFIQKLTSKREFVQTCENILKHCSDEYVCFNALKCFETLIPKLWNQFSAEQRINIRDFFWNVLIQRGPKFPRNVTSYTAKIFCRISKRGWFDDPRMRDIADKISKFFKSIHHYELGLLVLGEMVQTISERQKGHAMTEHRRCAVSFRDKSLFRLFQYGITGLRKAITPGLRNADRVTYSALELCQRCLQFDFLGTNPDESAVEVGTVQAPVAWRPIVQDRSTVALLFSVYERAAREGPGSPKYAHKVLEVLSSLALIRRSIFNSERERGEFLQRLMKGVGVILSTQKATLKDEANYHQFCRLLGKLKANFQLAELVSTDGYKAWLKMVADFTVASFKSWEWSCNSTHYILQLWARMVSATPYVKKSRSSMSRAALSVVAGSIMPAGMASTLGLGTGMSSDAADSEERSTHLLDLYVPHVVETYIGGRLKLLGALFTEPDKHHGLTNPLEENGVLETHLQHIPMICRFQYKEVSEKILKFFAEVSTRWQMCVRHRTTGPRMKMLSHQMAWLIHIISSLLNGKLPVLNRRKNGPQDEITDALLCKPVFTLVWEVIKMMQSTRGAFKPDECLELAILSFFKSFQKTYVGEHRGMPPAGSPPELISSAAPTEKQQIYLRYFENMGMGKHQQVIDNIVKKLCCNLKYFAKQGEIIGQSLKIFAAFVCGYSSGRIMLELATVKEMLKHHSPKDFEFLSVPDNSKNRSTFYMALSRLIWYQDGQTEFELFMRGHIIQLRKMAKVGDDAFRSPACRQALIGVCRDLIGILEGAHNSRTYCMAFDSIFPYCFPAMIRGMKTYIGDPQVTTAILKFVTEFVTNKAQRIKFDHCSPNGILLFRKTSEITVAYRMSMEHLRKTGRFPSDMTDDLKYKHKYKGISLCLNMLTCALRGKYVNFGVFALYKDPKLKDSIMSALGLVVWCDLNEVLQFPKAAKPFYLFLEAVFKSHLETAITLDVRQVTVLLRALRRGLTELDTHISVASASAVDHLATFYFKCKRKKIPGSERMIAIFSKPPLSQVFLVLLKCLFEIVLLTECAHQWSINKPMLSLILAERGIFAKFRKDLIDKQPKEEHKRKLHDCFSLLMKDIRPNLEQGNRDRFGTQLLKFRQEVRAFLFI